MQSLTDPYPEITSCNHSCCEHIWNPYCDEIPVWKTVAIIALTVLSGLIVPLAICYLITCCFNRKAESAQAKPSEDFASQAVHTVQNNQGGQLGQNVPSIKPPLPQIGKEAAVFAQGNITAESGQAKPSEDFTSQAVHTVQNNQGGQLPQNVPSVKLPPLPQIGMEAALFAREKIAMKPNIHASVVIEIFVQSRSTAQIAFYNVLKDKQNWSNEEVLTAADEFMKLSYAIGLAILGAPEPVAAATSQEHFYFPRAYREIRAAMQIEEANKRVYPKAEEITEFAQLFYQESRHQNWRLLYNDYCDRVALIVTGQALADIASELQKDMGMEFVPQVS